MPPYDEALRRRGVRKGRETGCWVYVPGEVLAKVGRYDPGTPPSYRVWEGKNGSVVVTLYAVNGRPK